jgi:hypothetical protein
MAIEFHCEHCNHLIRAPEDAAGRTGRCPHCHNAAYIPRPVQDEGELDFAPLDEEEESRRRRAAVEDAALQQRLLHERSVPGEPGGRAAAARRMSGSAPPPAAPAPSTKNLTSSIVSYIESLSTARLDKAEELLAALTPHRAAVLEILDEMSRAEPSSYGLPALPRPVLAGFLKQLRTRL